MIAINNVKVNLNEFKDIPSFKGLYEINQQGQVWSYRNNKIKDIGDKRTITLYKNGKAISRSIKRLIDETFYNDADILNTMSNYPIIGFENYCILEDKRVWSHTRNRFIQQKDGFVTLSQNGTIKKINVDTIWNNMIEINNSQNITMKDIQNYEGLYKITQDGRVWNCNLFRFLSPRQSVNGYLRIGLTKNGVKTTYSIHRLVAETFIPNPNHLPQVNHIDENKLNNNINNLEWCDYLYNNTYGTRIERVVKTNKNRTPVKCIETNEIYASQGQAARSIGRYNAPIGYACKTGGTAYGYHWRFMSKEEYENETNNLS